MVCGRCLDHRSRDEDPGGDCEKGDKATEDGVACASEANGVIKKYNALSGGDQQDLVNFLRSL